MAICLHCGGSGIQRVSEQRFRTCLTCLGNGDGQLTEPSDTSLRFPTAEARVIKTLSAAVSSSAAR